MNKHTALQEYTRYVSLNVAAMLGLSLYILADTFFVAQGVGSDGLAALNLAVPLYNIMHGTGLMLGMGGATKFTLLASQGKHRDANRLPRRFRPPCVPPCSFSCWGRWAHPASPGCWEAKAMWGS